MLFRSPYVWVQRIRESKEMKVKSSWNDKINEIRLDKDFSRREVENPKGIGIKHNGNCIEMN